MQTDGVLGSSEGMGDKRKKIRGLVTSSEVELRTFVNRLDLTRRKKWCLT